MIRRAFNAYEGLFRKCAPYVLPIIATGGIISASVNFEQTDAIEALERELGDLKQ